MTERRRYRGGKAEGWRFGHNCVVCRQSLKRGDEVFATVTPRKPDPYHPHLPKWGWRFSHVGCGEVKEHALNTTFAALVNEVLAR